MKVLSILFMCLTFFETSAYQEIVDKLDCYDTLATEHGVLCAIKPSDIDSRTHNLNILDGGRDFFLGMGYHVIGIPNNLNFLSQYHVHFVGSYARPYDQFTSKFLPTPFIDEGMENGRLMIVPAYNNSQSVTLDTCSSEVGMNTNDCAGKVRLQKQYGIGFSGLNKTNYFNSVEYRKNSIFLKLKELNIIPSWRNSSWSSLEVSGHSQGGNHSLYIAKYIGVRSACLIAGGFDIEDNVYHSGVELADWIQNDIWKTELSKIKALLHTKDEFFPYFKKSLTFIGLYEIGNVVEVSNEVMTNMGGVATDNGHVGVMSGVELAGDRKNTCF